MISQAKLAVVKIQIYFGRRFLFAMCSATDSYDIALSAQNVDICEYMFDGDGADPHAQDKLDYSHILLSKILFLWKILKYKYSGIDATQNRKLKELDFSFCSFSAVGPSPNNAVKIARK